MSNASTHSPQRSAPRPPASAAAEPPGGGRFARLGRWLRALLPDVGLVSGGYLITILLTTLIFQPLAAWPLAFICLVPWTVATCRTHHAWVAHWLSFVGGWAFFLINLRWLWDTTDLGDVALAFYLAIYWTLAAWAVRTARRRGISPVWSLPVVWVACEYLRAFVMSGFPWFFIAHGFAKALPFIQISDLTGAYGVTFLAALFNGLFAEAILRRWPAAGEPRRGRQLFAGALTAIVLLVATLGYGYWRLGQASQFREGPVLTVVQDDFPLVSHGENTSPARVFRSYLRTAAVGVQWAQELGTPPDLVVFPETVWGGAQNRAFVEGARPRDDDRILSATWRWGVYTHRATGFFARGDYAAVNRVLDQLGLTPRLPEVEVPPAAVLVGSKSVDLHPDQPGLEGKDEYNSALLYDPNGVARWQRYDKVHLVPFGERVPFRASVRLRALYLWLNYLSPFSVDLEGRPGMVHYSLTPGTEFTAFNLKTAAGDYRFGTPICYEDVMPYVPRRFVWDGPRRRVDFLVSISNDGWFGHGAELPQHLAICVFRAVENRIGIARAVNTGISGFVDGNGQTYSLVTDEQGRYFGAGIVGTRTDHVRIDSRASFYGCYGDWLPRLCLVLAALLWVEGIIARWVWAARLKFSAWRRRRRGAHA